MMMRVTREILIGILITSLIITGFVGCVKNGVVDSGDPEVTEQPELPPVSSMSMDFSAFGGGKMAPSALPAGKNFTNAAVRVIVVDAVAIVVLAPPVALFKAAGTTTPVWQPDGSWVWRYSVRFLGQKYDAELTGRLGFFKTIWSMKVTNEALRTPLKDFEWYSGETALDNKSGSWRFFDPATPDEGNEVATIEWWARSEDRSEIIYSNTNERGENFGDTLSYSVEETTATIAFYDASKGITADITWDLIAVAGSIKVPDYNNGARAYWDEDKQDVIP